MESAVKCQSENNKILAVETAQLNLLKSNSKMTLKC